MKEIVTALVSRTVDKFKTAQDVFAWAMFWGYGTIEDFKSSLYHPHSDWIRNRPEIRVTDDKHEFVIAGVVPGGFATIRNLYLDAVDKDDMLYLRKVEERFAAQSNKYYGVMEIGETPKATLELTSDGNLVSGVLPCYTGIFWLKDKNQDSPTVGKWIQSETRNLYTTSLSGKPGAQVISTKPAMTRPWTSVSNAEDDGSSCFTCTHTELDGTQNRCQEAIDETYEAQVEACYEELELQKKMAKAMEPVFEQFGKTLREELAKLFPDVQIANALAKANMVIADCDYALDYLDNNQESEIKSNRFNPVVGSLGFNIGDKYSPARAKKVKYLTVKSAKSKLLAKRNKFAELSASYSRVSS